VYGPEAARATEATDEPTDEEFRQVQDAVLRECIVNMARIKEAITQALGAPSEAQGLDQVPQLVRGITAGLLMLGKQRAVEVMERVGRALSGIVRPEPGALALPRLDRLADAIVAVEYYMEMLQAGRADQWHMLENAETCLEEIEQASSKVIALRPRATEARADAAAKKEGTNQERQARLRPAAFSSITPLRVAMRSARMATAISGGVREPIERPTGPRSLATSRGERSNSPRRLRRSALVCFEPTAPT